MLLVWCRPRNRSSRSIESIDFYPSRADRWNCEKSSRSIESIIQYWSRVSWWNDPKSTQTIVIFESAVMYNSKLQLRMLFAISPCRLLQCNSLVVLIRFILHYPTSTQQVTLVNTKCNLIITPYSIDVHSNTLNLNNWVLRVSLLNMECIWFSMPTQIVFPVLHDAERQPRRTFVCLSFATSCWRRRDPHSDVTRHFSLERWHLTHCCLWTAVGL